jgi:hypothetical protein
MDYAHRTMQKLGIGNSWMSAHTRAGHSREFDLYCLVARLLLPQQLNYGLKVAYLEEISKLK